MLALQIVRFVREVARTSRKVHCTGTAGDLPLRTPAVATTVHSTATFTPVIST
jgi:hypothetical protein